MSIKIDFIKESVKVHKDKYDYSLVDYKKSSEKVVIICKEHGPFEQRASNHLRGRGCNNCKKTRKYDNKKFIDLSNIVHNGKYLYNKVIYNGSHNNIIITCLEHGDFKQTPTNHLSGKGCGKCATDSFRISDFFKIVNDIHNNRYTYFEDYINLRTKIVINCKEHGDFIQRAKNHLEGQGCPTCGDRFGIKENNDPDTNTIYEFNGDFWHGNPKLYNENDMNSVLNKTFGELYKKTINREEYLMKKGYNVISIWENDFNKQNYQL